MRHMMRAAAALAAAMLSACTPPPVPPADQLVLVDFSQLPGWTSDHVASVLPGLAAQCRRLALLPVDTALGGEGLAARYGGKAGQWAAACRVAASLPGAGDEAVRVFLKTWFQPYRVNAPGLFTGYYEPEVAGSVVPGGGFVTPLLARPSDLLQSPAETPGGPPSIVRIAGGKSLPYWTRSEIEAGAMGAQARPLFWLRNRIDLFFLQIQGSGRVRLPDGEVRRVTFAGKNGQPYTPIGRVLLERGALRSEDVSMQSIRAWLEAHPAEADPVMDRNADYVFFRELNDPDNNFGPPGALGVKLSAGRSAAVDRAFIPLATPIFIDTTDPLTNAPWRRLLLAQDLGTDIKGPARADVFFGAGDAAEQAAGRMRQAGTLYTLLPRPPP